MMGCGIYVITNLNSLGGLMESSRLVVRGLTVDSR
jgi:hypothetical protein